MIPIARVCILVALLLPAGCSGPRESIPTYSPMDPQDSLEAIALRNEQIQNVSGEGTITLTDRSGRSVRFDAAFVFAPPQSARLRAWKFGQAVLDLTVLPENVWLYVPRRSDGRDEDIRAASAETSSALREWLALLFGDLRAGEANITASDTRIVVSRPTRDGMKMLAFIDRKTLTPRRYELFSDDGDKRFELELGAYRMVEHIVWPTRIEVISADGRRVRVELRVIEVNTAPAAAFQPPPRAERLP